MPIEAAKLQVSIETNAQAAKAEISGFGQELNKTAKTGTSSLGRLADGFKSFKANILPITMMVGGAVIAMKKVIDFTAEGAQLEQLEIASRNLARSMGTDMDLIVRKVRAASMGTVTDTNIMLSANRALQLGVTTSAEEMATLMDIAISRSKTMGISVTQAFDDIVTGIGRGSPLILDNLGIVVNATEANKAYAESIGKTAAELSEEEKTQALLNVVLEQGSRNLDNTADSAESAAIKVQQFTTNWKNSMEELQKSPMVGQLFGDAVGLLDKLLFGTREVTRGLRDEANAVVETNGAYEDYYKLKLQIADEQNLIIDKEGNMRRANGQIVYYHELMTQAQFDQAQWTDGEIKRWGASQAQVKATGEAIQDLTADYDRLQFSIEGAYKDLRMGHEDKIEGLREEKKSIEEEIAALQAKPKRSAEEEAQLAEKLAAEEAISAEIEKQNELYEKQGKLLTFNLLQAQAMADNALSANEAANLAFYAEKSGLISPEDARAYDQAMNTNMNADPGQFQADYYAREREKLRSQTVQDLLGHGGGGASPFAFETQGTAAEMEMTLTVESNAPEVKADVDELYAGIDQLPREKDFVYHVTIDDPSGLFGLAWPAAPPVDLGIAGKAKGGPVVPGRPYVVGEDGPEVFTPSGYGNIIPNSQLAQSSGAFTNYGPITILVNELSETGDVDKLVRDSLR